MTSPTATDILQCIRDYPGIHLRGIERTLGLSSALVHYHLKDLLERDVVRAESLHGYTRYFDARATGSPGLTTHDRQVLAFLREETPMRIVLLLLDEGPLAHGDLVGKTDLAKSTVSYQLDKLVSASVVGRVEAGAERLYRLVDEARVRRLVLANRPAPEVRGRFRRLWEDFYGR